MKNVVLRVPAPKGVDTIVYRRMITSAGKDSVAGTRRVFIQIAETEYGRAFQVVQRFPGGGGEITDTALANPLTLGALAHFSHQPTKTMRFDLRDGFADGKVTDTTRRAESVHQAIGRDIFDSNIIDIVVASLPLEKGFSKELPFFIYERGGRVPMKVAVQDRVRVALPLGIRDAWVVSVAVPGAPATIWVDALTRSVLRVRYDVAARAMSFTDDRVTPLRPLP